jgi:hypothetical protein
MGQQTGWHDPGGAMTVKGGIRIPSRRSLKGQWVRAKQKTAQTSQGSVDLSVLYREYREKGLIR